MTNDAEQNKPVVFMLNGRSVEAREAETIFDVARREGISVPHLCTRTEPDYRTDGNCRACMVEIEGERVLAASCIRKPQQGMKVSTDNARSQASQRMVFELLLADQRSPAASPDPSSHFFRQTSAMDVLQSRFDARRHKPSPDRSHTAMAVNLDACIHCNLCVRACREVQSNDVIGMAGRGARAKIIFDFDDPMGDSTCVACGECVQACPTGALMPASEVDDKQLYKGAADKSVDSLCPYCGVGCQTRYFVKDGRIRSVEGRFGPANRNRLCVKGRFGFDYTHHADRLTKPLIRKEGVGKTWDAQANPADPSSIFREASWEEALEVAARGLRAVADRHGGDAIAGFGSAKGSNEEAYLFQKMIRTAFRTNNVDHCTRLCHASSVAALLEGLGSGGVTAPFTQALDADCIVVIGARPTENHPVAATFLKRAAKKGARLIVMDPRGHALTRYAWKHLAFTPGRDVALLNAMIHTIIEEDLTDRQYIQAHTSDFDKLAERIRGFSPESMSKICGIDAETIREVARAYARAERAIIFWGMGISQHVHGTDNARCLIALAAITGQIGRVGTGLHPLRGQNNVQGASDAGLIPMVYPDYQPVDDDSVRAWFEQFWQCKLNPNKGLTVVEIINAAHRREIKGMAIMGENPAMSDPDARHVREALARLQHLVVQEIFLTETAVFADVVLPASAFAEKEGTFTNTNRQVQLARRVLPPPGEAREDWVILQQLAQGLGCAWNYGSVEEIYEEMRITMQSSIKGISWRRLQREGAVVYPCASEEEDGKETLFGDGFPTQSGRLRLVPTDLVAPAEMPDAQYPYILTTGRLLEHWHTGAMTRRSETLDTLEPEALVCLHPREARKKHLVAGQRVRVETRRGEVEAKLRLDREVAEGMLFMPFCFAESPANFLTNPQLDPIGKIPEFKFCAAQLTTPSQNDEHAKTPSEALQKAVAE